MSVAGLSWEIGSLGAGDQLFTYVVVDGMSVN